MKLTILFYILTTFWGLFVMAGKITGLGNVGALLNMVIQLLYKGSGLFMTVYAGYHLFKLLGWIQ